MVKVPRSILGKRKFSETLIETLSNDCSKISASTINQVRIKSEEGPYLKVDIEDIKMESNEIDLVIELKNPTILTDKMKEMEDVMWDMQLELK